MSFPRRLNFTEAAAFLSLKEEEAAGYPTTGEPAGWEPAASREARREGRFALPGRKAAAGAQVVVVGVWAPVAGAWSVGERGTLAAAASRRRLRGGGVCASCSSSASVTVGATGVPLAVSVAVAGAVPGVMGASVGAGVGAAAGASAVSSPA
eukprot:1153573-Prorocentrum_minimum.AAC.1